jgi:hypothetical protein
MHVSVQDTEPVSVCFNVWTAIKQRLLVVCLGTKETNTYTKQNVSKDGDEV